MHKRILVVDDVPDWQASLEAILNEKKSEYEVKAVDSYQAAMEVIKNREVELVIVDLRLSSTDDDDRQGMKLLGQLAKHRINSIVLTGYPERELQEEAEERYQTFDFIDKGTLARNSQHLREVVYEAFQLMEGKEKKKNKFIQDASNGQSVSFPEDLSSWPLRKYRKSK